MNKVVLVGRLTSKPELKNSNDKAYTKFAIAVNRSYKNSDGTRDADFINLVAWGKNAENICKYLDKGNLIAIDGSILTGSYDDKDGNKRYTFDINVDNFEFVESKKETTEEPATV